MARARTLLRPGWLVLHAVTAAAIVAMVLLGRWQLTVSEHKHFSLQNFGYALQWWVFCAFAAFMWWRVVRDALRRGAPALDGRPGAPAPTAAEGDVGAGEPVAYRRYVMPRSADGPSQVLDAEQQAYNDYLAELARRDRDPTGEGRPTGRKELR